MKGTGRVTVVLHAQSTRRLAPPRRTRPTWRDRSDLVMVLRWWRARLAARRTLRKARHRA